MSSRELMIYKLGEIADVQTGPFGSQLHQSDYVEVGTPIVTVEHLGERKLSSESVPFVCEKDRVRLNKYCLKDGDMVFSRVGSVDRCSLVSKNEDGWLFSGRCLRVRPNKNILYSKYLYYLFCLERMKEHIRGIAVGATMPSINTKILSGISITIPSKPLQKSIADILSCLDDKIELNNRINKNLEEMAQAIFKSWFVDFEPFQDGEFEDSELGRIPKGWRVGIIGDLTTIITRGITPKYCDSADQYVINQKCIRNGLLDTNLARLHKSKVNEDKQVQIGDVLVNSTGVGTLGRVAQVYKKLKNYTVDSHVTIVRPINSSVVGYLGCAIQNMQESFEYAATGSTGQTELGRESIKQMKILIPCDKVISDFTDIYNIIYNKIINNQIENDNCCMIRDSLLPKLMSGEIRVPLEEVH